jgi:hypothetical protein
VDADGHVAATDRSRSEYRCRPAGQLPDRLGHERGTALVARGDEPNACLGQRFEEAEEALARDRKGPLDARFGERRGNQLTDGQGAAYGQR